MTQTAEAPPEAVADQKQAVEAEAAAAGGNDGLAELMARWDAMDEQNHPSSLKNFPAPELAGWRRGEKALFLADWKVRAIGQSLVDSKDRHFHLREARIIILMQTGQTANADRMVSLGKAVVVSPLINALAVRAGEDGIDFVIRLNGEQWADAGIAEQARLVDHELLHCGVTIAGKYMKLGGLAAFVAALGADHVETCDRMQDDKGRILVRFRKRAGDIKPGSQGWGDQAYAWRLRKHDYEDFRELMAGYGLQRQAAEDIRRMCDELEKPDDGQRELPLGEESQTEGRKVRKEKSTKKETAEATAE